MTEGRLGRSVRQQDHFFLDVSRGLFVEMFGVNKFGRTTNADSGVLTDIWDGANATTDQDIWVSPTAARIHTLVSTSTADDGSPVGLGAHAVKIYGLDSDWNALDEIVVLNGTTGVTTIGSYIRIFRMAVVGAGAGGTNAGIISATAATDLSITALITIGQGQTQMAIYTVPVGHTAFMTQYYVSINSSGGTIRADTSLLARADASVSTSLFVIKHTQAAVETGGSHVVHDYKPYFKISEKSDIKLQVTSTGSNVDVSGGFDLIVRQNEPSYS